MPGPPGGRYSAGMNDPLRLMLLAAHPDDESLGFGGVLAHYARAGVETFVLAATRGDRGRYLGHRFGSPEHPGPQALADIRTREVEAACRVLGVRDVIVLDYPDQQLDQAEPSGAIAAIVGHLRRIRPQVILTFAPDGAYGHPDHIAISQFATAAAIASADPCFAAGAQLGPAHTISKLYYLAWDEDAWAAYEAGFKKLVSVVDGVERQATAWPNWALTTIVDTADAQEDVWRAVACHTSQTGTYEALTTLAPAQRRALWRTQSFYRAVSLVNGGRTRETDLFEGLR
jgi:LmbE family N-acetylglucosaminyl deacetylase